LAQATLAQDRYIFRRVLAPLHLRSPHPQLRFAMAVLAQVFVAMAALSALALANNLTAGGGNGSLTTTATTTETLTTFTPTTSKTSSTATTTTATSNVSAPSTATTTATTTADPNAVQFTEQVVGTMSLTITGDCAAFVNDSSVILACAKSIATVASVNYTFVSVLLSHTCSRRMSEFQQGTSALRRRLGGAVVVDYTIDLPVGSSISGASVSSFINATNLTSWSSTLAAKLAAEGVNASAYTVTVSAVAIPTVVTVTMTTTMTTLEALSDGIDSSAFFRKAFSMAHLWGLFLLLMANKFFA